MKEHLFLCLLSLVKVLSKRQIIEINEVKHELSSTFALNFLIQAMVYVPTMFLGMSVNLLKKTVS